MIKNRESLSMAEATDLIHKEKGEEFLSFIRKFVKLKTKDAQEMRKSFEELKMMKLDERVISKLIDLLPETNEELNKIFIGVSLDEDENEKVLEIIKKFK